jgi:acyl-CoA reductase-like NAD-dependent aldehyde dehydrogenase
MLHTNTQNAMLIGGDLVAGLDVEPVTNPADLSIVGMAPVAGPMHLEQALRAARSAFPAWSRLTKVTQ